MSPSIEASILAENREQIKRMNAIFVCKTHDIVTPSTKALVEQGLKSAQQEGSLFYFTDVVVVVVSAELENPGQLHLSI